MCFRIAPGGVEWTVGVGGFGYVSGWGTVEGATNDGRLVPWDCAVKPLSG